MQTLTTDLTAVIPAPKLLTIAGEDLAIRQIKVGALPAALLAVQPILSTLMQREKPLDLPKMFIRSTDDCLNLLSVMSGKPRTWVDDLEIDDAIQLFTPLLEANLDFFVQRVLPQLPEVLVTLRKVMESLSAKAGQIASKP
jgi:hypothetical protein